MSETGTETQQTGAGAADGAASPAPDRVGELEKELAGAKAALVESERRRAVQTALIDARAVDVDAAGVLVEQALGGEGKVSIDQAVRDLKRRKPHLFISGSHAAGAMGAHVQPATSGIADLAESAAATGDRRRLLRYLRARRGA